MSQGANQQAIDRTQAVTEMERIAPSLRPVETKSAVQSIVETLAELFGRSGRNAKLRLVIVASLGLAAVAGCGASEAGRLTVYAVRGQVKIDGKPAVGAFVVLHPKGSKGAGVIRPCGYVRKDGTFEVTSYESNDGAPAGEYKATVQYRKMIVYPSGDRGPGPNVVGKLYAKPDTSPINVEVTTGSNELPAILLKEAPPEKDSQSAAKRQPLKTAQAH